MSDTVASPAKSKSASPLITILIASLMLFSMFFGAGNLIFPPMVGVSSGTNFWPAIIGFLIAGVLLPVAAIVSIAISGYSVRDLAGRGGLFFGIAFSVMAYLSIGAFYALPRTGAVSMETAITPLLGWEGTAANGIFNVIFFGIALALSWKPNNVIDILGRFLTPALVILLIALITLAVTNYERIPGTPTEAYESSPLVTGLFEGYNTMDAIAGLAFGIVIISSLRAKGFGRGGTLIRSTIITGIIAGTLLAAIYLGLGYMAQTVPDGQSYESGAILLADSANLTMGTPGQTIFSLIVVLACLTTAVGLITSTSEFFNSLVPKISYHAWAIIFTVLSILIAFRGLEAVMAVAVPFIVFLYPPAITLIVITLVQPLVRKVVGFYWAYRLALWVSVLWSALTTISAQGWGTNILEPMLNLSPGQDLDLGWIAPTFIAFIIGVVIDVIAKNADREVQKAKITD